MAKKCVKCGFELNDSDMFCVECGTPQPKAAVYCSNCGAEIPEGGKFCTNCGTPVSLVSSSVEVPVAQSKYPDSIVSQPDQDTISITIKGVTFNMKLVEGGMVDKYTELSDFYIGETVVTQELWMMVMDVNPSEDNSDLQLPVTNVNTTLCTSFLLKLKTLTGREFSLPTVYQWEYAYRGGNKSLGHKYAGGNNLNKIAWTESNSEKKLHPVGQLLPNELGLCDMEGNVHEFVEGKCSPCTSYRLNPESGDQETIVSSSAKYHSWEKKKDNSFLGLRLAMNIQVEKDYAEKRTKALTQSTYTLSIVRIHAIKKAIKTVETVLGWSTEEANNKLAKLPAVVATTNDSQEIADFYEKLAEGGMGLMVTSRNGFGDISHNTIDLPIHYRWDGNTVDNLLEKYEGEWVLFDFWGNTLNHYDGIGNYCEGLARVIKGKKRGFVDETGCEIIPCKYEAAKDFHNGMSRVKMKGKYGFIDRQGNLCVPCKYEDANDFSEGMARVMRNGKIGFVDDKGNEVIPCTYKHDPLKSYTGDFHDGLAIVKDDNSDYVYIDKQGNEFICCDEYDGASDFSEGMARVEVVIPDSLGLLRHYGYINKEGQEIVPCDKYDMAEYFHNGLAVVRDETTKYFGAINTKGEIVVACKYESLLDFENGLAEARLDDTKWVTIDSDGKIVSRPTFCEGMAIKKKGKKYGYINENNDEVIPCKYDEVWDFNEGIALVSINEEYGFVDKKGTLIVPCEYEFDEDLDYDNDDDDEPIFKFGMALISQDDKYFLFDKKGVKLLEFSTDYDVKRLAHMIAFRLS